MSRFFGRNTGDAPRLAWKHIFIAAAVPVLYIVFMLVMSGIMGWLSLDAVMMTCIFDSVIGLVSCGLLLLFGEEKDERRVTNGIAFSGTFITIAFWFICSVIATVLYAYFGDTSFDMYVESQQTAATWSLLLTVVLAPVSEELLFRGLVYGQLRRSGLGFWFAGLSSSIVFSVFHGTMVHIVPAMFMGMWFVSVYEYTGRIWWSMIAHSFYNMLVIVGTGIAIPDFFMNIPTVMVLTGLLVCFLLFFREYPLKGKQICYKGIPIASWLHLPSFVNNKDDEDDVE